MHAGNSVVSQVAGRLGNDATEGRNFIVRVSPALEEKVAALMLESSQSAASTMRAALRHGLDALCSDDMVKRLRETLAKPAPVASIAEAPKRRGRPPKVAPVAA